MPGPSAPGRLLLLHPSSGGGWGVVADPGAGPGCGVAGGRGGQAVALPPRGTLVPALGAAACGACAGRQRSRRSCRSGAGCWSEPSLLLVRGRLDPARDTLGDGRASALTLPAAVTQALLTRVPAAFHGGIDDVLLTGLAVAVADWCRRHVRAVRAVAAKLRRQPCGAARSRGPWPEEGWRGWPRGGVWRRRPDADGGLVHQPLSGAARSGPARSRGGAGGGSGAGAGAEDASRSSCARCQARGLAMGCCAISTTTTAGQLAGPAGAAAWLQLPGPVCSGLGDWAPDWSAASLDESDGARGGCRAAGGGDPAMPLAHVHRDQRADAGWGGRPAADGELDVGAGAAR